MMKPSENHKINLEFMPKEMRWWIKHHNRRLDNHKYFLIALTITNVSTWISFMIYKYA